MLFFLPAMKLLALDTATERMAVAVVHGTDVFTHEAQGGAATSTELLPCVLALLARAGLSLAELDAVAVGQGPGAFTGLRTAISVAQGLAFGAAKPVLLLDSLRLVAEDARQQAGGQVPSPLWVAMDARMDEIYAGAYHYAEATGWQELVPPGLYDLPTLNACWAAQAPAAVAGSALEAFAGRLVLGAQALCWPRSQSRAAALAQLAVAAWQAGASCAPDEALPLYLRDKVAQTTAERQAAKLAALAEAKPCA
jgi:tRNA threonylcarbamoyladenosine biosynthesis protein TsaB